jgi:hypothetical protein
LMSSTAICNAVTLMLKAVIERCDFYPVQPVIFWVQSRLHILAGLAQTTMSVLSFKATSVMRSLSCLRPLYRGVTVILYSLSSSHFSHAYTFLLVWPRQQCLSCLSRPPL